MQSENNICACSGGHIKINTGTERYYLSPDEIRTLLVFGNGVPLCQESGIIDAEATAFLHPGGLGIVIAVPGNTWLVPRDCFTGIARGALAEARMQPVPWTGAFS
jgi:hypothetical protein